MPDKINYLNDPHHRYQVMWISQVELAHERNKFDWFNCLNERLEACEPGTTIAKIYYDNYRQCHGIVLHNDEWPATILGEELPTYRYPIKTSST